MGNWHGSEFAVWFNSQKRTLCSLPLNSGSGCQWCDQRCVSQFTFCQTNEGIEQMVPQLMDNDETEKFHKSTSTLNEIAKRIQW